MTLERMYHMIREEERRRHEKWWAWLEARGVPPGGLTPVGGAATVALKDKGQPAR